MKKIYSYILYFIIFNSSLIYFAGCGSDTVTGGNGNNNPPGEVLLFHADSIVHYANEPNYSNTLWEQDTAKINSYRIKFTGTVNDTNTTLALLEAFGNMSAPIDSMKGNDINVVYNKVLPGDSTAVRSAWTLQLRFVNGVADPSKFIRLRNFEIYKVD